MCECCGRWHGAKKLILGALLLLNAFVWPLWLGIDGWIVFIAALMVIWGIVKLIWPMCCSGTCETGSKPSKKKR